MTADLREQLQAALGTAYSIERELGGGGMSRVFVATETALGRKVVVKVLPPETSSAVSAERFRREIQLAAKLHHPHVVPVHSAGEAGGLLYYTMPLVEGESLRAKLLREGELPVPAAVRLLREVADALAYAHAHGVVHRDLKPENILLEHRHAVVTDFGVAKALTSAAGSGDGSGSGSLTSVGVALGTPAYMAPEQAAADPNVDHRADLYALGCVAYEILTGAAPFAHRTAQQILAAHVAEAPEPLERRRSNLPPSLPDLVMRLLEKRPADRPQSAEDVLAVLEAMPTSGSGASAPAERAAAKPASATPAPARARRRFPTGVAILVLGFLLGAGVLFAWRAHERAGAPPGAVTVAVLPFENLGDSSEAYFADGITDAVRGKLSAVPAVRVIARSSSTQYRGTPKTPQQIGAELGVQYLLTGTVRWAKGGNGASRVQVSPELVRTTDASTKWQQPFDAALTDVFQVQGQIAGEVADALGVALGSGAERALTARPTQNLAAYDAFLRGEEVLNSAASDQGSVSRAVADYDRAVALDPGFALAWAQLSRARSLAYGNAQITRANAEGARTAAERALALAPDRYEGRLALGNYYTQIANDQRRALEQYALAERLAPNNAEVLAAEAVSEQGLGRWDASVDHFRRALALDPRSARTASRLARTLLWLRRYPEASAASDRALVLAPKNLAGLENKAMISLARGELAGARALLRAASRDVDPAALAAYVATYWDLAWVLDDEQQRLLLRLTPDAFADDPSQWAIVLTQTYALRGDAPRARAYADTARAAFEPRLRDTPNDAQLRVLFGLALAYMGRKADAVREGERAVAMLPVSKDAYGGAYNEHQLVRIYILAGEPEKALDHLEPLLKMPYYLSPGWLKIDPTFDPLRTNPRFQRLVAGRPSV